MVGQLLVDFDGLGIAVGVVIERRFLSELTSKSLSYRHRKLKRK